MTVAPNAEYVRFVKLQIWTRHTEDWGDETIYKLPDGTEYRGNVYGLVDAHFDGTGADE